MLSDFEAFLEGFLTKCNPNGHDTLFSPQIFPFSIFPNKKSLSPRTPFLFPHLSNYCSDKKPNLSQYTGEAYPKRSRVS